MSNLFIPVRGIVKIRKPIYNFAHTDYRCDLLVIRVCPQNYTAIVRYPDGYTQEVSIDDILASSIVDPKHPSYINRLINMPAFLVEFRINNYYKEKLKADMPELYDYAQEKLTKAIDDLSAQTPEEEPTAPTLTPTTPTTSTVDSIQYLKSIDDKLGLILNLLREVM